MDFQFFFNICAMWYTGLIRSVYMPVLKTRTFSEVWLDKS